MNRADFNRRHDTRGRRQRGRTLVAAALVLVPFLYLFVVRAAEADTARASRGMVATVHPRATDAGVAVLERGGNAVDAAVAAALTLGVVDGHNSGIGGGCFMVLRTSEGKITAIDGRETAPAKATRDMFLRDGQPDADRSTTGPLAVATPGALAAYAHAVEQYGSRELRELLEPAAQLAEQGFPLDAIYATRLARHADQLKQFAGSRAVLFHDGQPYGEGDVVRQADLARTYRAIGQHGIEWFYRGPFAERVGVWMAEHGGVLGREDFAAYRAREREPVRSTYRNLTIIGYPPPSSGGVHVAQILNMLESFELAEMSEAERTHVIVEAMKRAFADRAHWLGDPAFARVPRGLIDKAYARRLAATIDRSRATVVERHGEPPRATRDHFGERHTTHIAAADAAGNWVAITTTINTSFGSKVIVPSTGVILNNQMDDFSAAPGVPNAFGLVGAEANAIEPGKRPLSSMSPTLVLEDDEPVMTLGAAGGPKIITAVLLTIVGRFDLKLSTEEAVAAARFHHQWVPDRVFVEATFPKDLAEALRARGHQVAVAEHFSVLQALARERNGGAFIGVSDPRVPGKAAGY
ncbi:MAG: gamma-glutamyltransferase [Planctomycetota bacterium]|nr:MAG: gamma-glutamyltransferase [Planctomycetota bacterium]REK46800.1 MAG: gamma-glutamyltransferase [Planctomycetota bacterium]